jgi:hypothetical protein
VSGRSCSVPGCEGIHVARGWCTLHYQRWQRSGHPGGCEQRQMRYTPGQVCAIDDMARKGRGKKAGLPGSRNGRAKLDAEQVKEIRDLRGAETGKSLAGRFRISQTQVSKIQGGEQWTAV